MFSNPGALIAALGLLAIAVAVGILIVAVIGHLFGAALHVRIPALILASGVALFLGGHYLANYEASAYRRGKQRFIAAAKMNHVLTYTIQTDCPVGANVIFWNKDGNVALVGHADNYWHYSFAPTSGQTVSLLATNQCDHGYVTAKFVLGGHTVLQHTQRGGYVLTNLIETWP